MRPHLEANVKSLRTADFVNFILTDYYNMSSHWTLIDAVV